MSDILPDDAFQILEQLQITKNITGKLLETYRTYGPDVIMCLTDTKFYFESFKYRYTTESQMLKNINDAIGSQLGEYAQEFFSISDAKEWITNYNPEVFQCGGLLIEATRALLIRTELSQ